MSFAICPHARAADEPGAAAPFVITNAGEYWNLPEAEKQLPQRIRLELLVYYYDPGWKLLWGESGGTGCYIYVRGRDLPLKAGQRVRLEGTVIPAAGIDGELVTVTVLAENVAPNPIKTDGNLINGDRFNAQWVSTEGYVCRQREVDPSHLRLEVISEGRMIDTHVQLAPNDPIPQLLNARVRMNYVYVAGRDPAGELRVVNGWVPSAKDITVIGWLESDARFGRPQVPIESIALSSSDDWVRIVGEIRALDPERSVSVRDATGQVVIRTQQSLNAKVGDFIEIVGRPFGRGLDVTLRDPTCRLVPPGTMLTTGPNLGRAEPLLKLRLADQVMSLRPDEASQHFPVFIRGVVTWSDPKAGFFFVQDASGGIRVQMGALTDAPPNVGMQIAVLGVSTNGAFSPEVELKELSIIAPSLCPPARPVSLEQALLGSEEAMRVEIRGYLRGVEHSGIWQQLNLTTTTGDFTAYVAPNSGIESLVGGIVRVTGVCSAVTNSLRQLTGIRLWLADGEAVQLAEAKVADPFLLPQRTIGSLRQFTAVRALDRQVRVVGAVIYDRPGRFFYLQNGDAGLLVLHRDTVPINPGEWVEVVGIPGREGERVILREGTWRKAPAGSEPVPEVIMKPGNLDPDADGRLVTVQGVYQNKVSDEGGRRLIVQADLTRFEARLDNRAATVLPREGSKVEITGVYALEYDEGRRPRGFTVQMRSAADLRVLETPTWWTTRRALGVAIALGLCAMFGVGWVLVLRRRVRQQTDQIRRQLENEARLNAELERAARLESLGVLAGGIAHDFNNLLTVIMANLGLAAMDDRVRQAAGDIIADAERGARRAADLTQQLLTFAKGGDPVRRAVALPDVVRESAEFARHGSRVRCDFVFDADLPPADVDRGQISRVVHNLVLNAAQAMQDGGVITIRLAEVALGAGEEGTLPEGRYVKLTVADDGPGIAPEHQARIFEPYFSTKPKNNGLGLATVHSIIKKHQGHIRVESMLGGGTTFHIWLPVAKELPAPAATAPTSPCGTVPLRVLFMDDEDVIRRTAAGIMRQLGHQAKLVSDGSEVVQEYEEAMRNGRRYDVVILDLTVPGGLGGRDAMAGLQRIDPKVRAIVSSGYSNDPVLANYRDYGFCAVVPKPYKVDDLARAIQDVADRGPEENIDRPLAV